MLQPRLIDVKPLKNFHLFLEYETGEKRVFDVKPYLTGGWYKELETLTYFNSVRLIINGEGIEWPNGQDVAPHELYDYSTSYEKWSGAYA